MLVVMIASVLAVIASLVIGWLAGMLTFRRAQRWCTTCGLSLTCPECDDARDLRVLAARGLTHMAANNAPHHF